jgi:hypothetical protein
VRVCLRVIIKIDGKRVSTSFPLKGGVHVGERALLNMELILFSYTVFLTYSSGEATFLETRLEMDWEDGEC